METVEARLERLGLTLPPAPAALAAYVPAHVLPLSGETSLLFIAGQVSSAGGEFMTGRVPDQVDLDRARAAARAAAVNVLAQIKSAGFLERVIQVSQLTGFVNSTADFGHQPEVVNAASELLVEVLGEAGRHTRVAVGAASLPRGVTVELSAVVAVRSRD